MARVKIRYYQVTKGRAYWKPTEKMKNCGFEAQSLGKDGPSAWQRAEELNVLWDNWRVDPGMAKRAYRPGTLGHLFDEYHKTNQWRIKAPATRDEWEYSFKTISPVFGDISVAAISFSHIDRFYEGMLSSFSLHKTHRVMKTLRALFNVAIAFELITANPTAGISNKAPRGRKEIWTPNEVDKLASKAWNEGYKALAVVIRLAYDTELAPVDIRQLTMRQKLKDASGVYFKTSRAKTGKRAYATLSERTASTLINYLASLDYVIPADQPFIRNRAGRIYTKDKLATDFRYIKKQLWPDDKRQLRDMRRTGNVEAAVGGAQPQDLSAKAGNTIAVSNSLFETYTPVQLAAVRRADKARKRGRKALKKNKKH